ncbi:hypothetical protein [Bacillus thuringiensis]|uniref:hypothetical protein n=1 Tax=Bacillus thuringiensis TaxID=1428 RepID=UPI001F5B246D|nr:hypothetical protein [Bacillus thuringiensis]
MKETDEELLQMYVDFSSCLGQAATSKQLNESHNIYNADVFSLRFGGMLELHRRAGFVSTYGTRKVYTKQGLADKLKRVYKVNEGRIPIRRFKEFGLCASTLMRYFQTTKINLIGKGVILRTIAVGIDLKDEVQDWLLEKLNLC